MYNSLAGEATPYCFVVSAKQSGKRREGMPTETLPGVEDITDRRLHSRSTVREMAALARCVWRGVESQSDAFRKK